jgi:beta-lactamase superfamily II metal-dependent hydrolase
VAGLALLPLVVWSSALSAGVPDGLTVRFFDVGQGDSALVTSPSGATVLIDGGPEEEQVATELAALGVKRLDVVVASHPHADHIIGLPVVLARIPVGLILDPGCEHGGLQAALDDAPAPRTRSATCAWMSCRPTAAGPAPSPTRTTTPS